MKKYLLIALIYAASASLAASCDKKSELKSLQDSSSDILQHIEQQSEEIQEIMLLSGAHNKCFSCNYEWNKNTDPNLY